MTKYYKRVVVSGTADTEILSDLLTSTEEEHKHIIALWFTETTGTLYGDSVIRAYVEREKIVDMSCRHFNTATPNDNRVALPRLEIDTDLPVGQTLSVGHISGGTASNYEFVAEYEITT